MILKSLSRRSGTRQLLTYLFANKDKYAPHQTAPFILKHNIRSHSIDKWHAEFEQNETYRLKKRKDNVKMYHSVISFSNKDTANINDETLRAIAKKYIALRGRDNMFLFTAHYDTTHAHLHCVMPSIRYLTGESNRMTKKEFQQLKIALDAFQKEKFPSLINSLPQHCNVNVAHLSKTEYQLEKRTGRTSDKAKLIEAISHAFNSASSLETFLRNVTSGGHEPYYRNNKATGIKLKNGRKFRFKRLGFDIENLKSRSQSKTLETKVLSEIQQVRQKGREQKRTRGTIER